MYANRRQFFFNARLYNTNDSVNRYNVQNTIELSKLVKQFGRHISQEFGEIRKL